MNPRVALLIAGSALTLATGFAAGRRWPRPTPRPAGELAANLPWRTMPAGPSPRYEPGAAVVNRKLFVFGGFHNWRIQASPRVEVWDAITGSWSRRRDMPTPTTHWMPVVVGDTIWLAGGFVGDHPGPATDRVWAYDITRDSWHTGPALPVPRGGGLLVAIDSVLHYIAGYGEDRQHAVADHWRLDLRGLGAGSTWQPLAPLPRPRGHSAGVALDGYIYAVGGTIRHDPVQIDVAMVDRYDLATDGWEIVADLPKPRSHHEAATFARNGLIYVAGGRSLPSGQRNVADLVVYDPAANQWYFDRRLPVGLLAPIALPMGDSLILGLGATAGLRLDQSRFWSSAIDQDRLRGTPLPIPIEDLAAGVVGDRLYLVGQNTDSTVRVYHLGTNEWEPPIARRPALGHSHTAEVLGNRLFVLGGAGRAAGILQILDPTSNQWHFGADLPFGAAGSASATIKGMVYAGGGIDPTGAVATAARYDPTLDRWTPIAPMPLARGYAGSGTDGQRWYVFGGRGPDNSGESTAGKVFEQVQIYDPSSDRWTVSGRDVGAPPPLPQPRTDMGRAIYANGEFWVIGGATTASGNRVSRRIDILDPVTNRWRRGPDLGVARRGGFPVLVGNRIYLVGGRAEGGEVAAREMEIINVARGAPAGPPR